MSGQVSIAAVALTLALAGCGGPSGSGGSSEPSSSSSSSSSSAAVASKTSATATTSTSPTRTTSTAGPGSAGARTSRTSSTTTTTTTNAAPSLPAQFMIEAGGRLSPALVAAPGHTDIQLSVRSRDGHAHRFVLDTPQPHVLKTSAGFAAGVRLVGLPNGTYPIEIDGVLRGKLIVGATPGP